MSAPVPQRPPRVIVVDTGCGIATRIAAEFAASGVYVELVDATQVVLTPAPVVRFELPREAEGFNAYRLQDLQQLTETPIGRMATEVARSSAQQREAMERARRIKGPRRRWG